MSRVRWKLLAIPVGLYLVAAALMTVTDVAWGLPTEGKRPMIGGLRDGGPAGRAGLQMGDQILAIDGRPIADTSEVAPAIDGGGDQVAIEVLRDGERRTIRVEPMVSDGARRIGIEIWPIDQYRPASFGACLADGFAFPVRYAVFAVRSHAQIFVGRAKAEFSGPVGVVKVMARTEKSQRASMNLLAILVCYLWMFSLVVTPILMATTRRR